MALTTISLYNQYTGKCIDSDERIRVEDIIDQVSDLVEKKCGRVFESTTYKDWIDGTNTNTLILPQFPITKIKRVSNCSNDAIKIENSGSDVATVSSNVSAITLNSIDSLANETETDLYFSSYANVSSMVTAMNNVSGWTAEASNISDNQPTLMQYTKPLYAENALDNEVHIELAGSNISVRPAYNSDKAIEGCFPYGRSNIYVEWVAGYTLPVDNEQHSDLSIEGNLPKGLILTVNKIVKDVLELVNEDTNMRSEIIGDYEYERLDASSIVDRYWKDLSEWSYVEA